jgi:hypothetical protein
MRIKKKEQVYVHILFLKFDQSVKFSNQCTVDRTVNHYTTTAC